MAKQRRRKAPGGAARRAATRKTAGPGKTAPPASGLIEFTHRGLDQLHARLRATSATDKKADKKGHALGAALERLKADYERVLKRRS